MKFPYSNFQKLDSVSWTLCVSVPSSPDAYRRKELYNHKLYRPRCAQPCTGFPSMSFTTVLLMSASAWCIISTANICWMMDFGIWEPRFESAVIFNWSLKLWALNFIYKKGIVSVHTAFWVASNKNRSKWLGGHQTGHGKQGQSPGEAVGNWQQEPAQHHIMGAGQPS